jgi:hypothetical protein
VNDVTVATFAGRCAEVPEANVTAPVFDTVVFFKIAIVS